MDDPGSARVSSGCLFAAPGHCNLSRFAAYSNARQSPASLRIARHPRSPTEPAHPATYANAHLATSHSAHASARISANPTNRAIPAPFLASGGAVRSCRAHPAIRQHRPPRISRRTPIPTRTLLQQHPSPRPARLPLLRPAYASPAPYHSSRRHHPRRRPRRTLDGEHARPSGCPPRRRANRPRSPPDPALVWPSARILNVRLQPHPRPHRLRRL